MVGLARDMLRIGAGALRPNSRWDRPSAGGPQPPSIQIDLSVADWPELLRRVLADELDLAIAEASHASDDERLISSHCESIGASSTAGSATHWPDGWLTLRICRFPMAFTAVPKRLLDLIVGSDAPMMTSCRGRLRHGDPRRDANAGQADRHGERRRQRGTPAARSSMRVARGSLVVLPIEVPGLATATASSGSPTHAVAGRRGISRALRSVEKRSTPVGRRARRR